MKIIVSGCLSLDFIKIPEFSIRTWGGIAYNIFILSFRKDAVIYPVTYIGKDFKAEILDMLPENCEKRCLKECRDTNKNTIHVLGENRYEFITPVAPKIGLDMLLCPGKSDLLYINPVMGWEFSQETLKNIDEINSDLKTIDVHNMTLGIGENGRRYPIRLEEKVVDTIIENFDIIQMNKKEYLSFTGKEFPQGLGSLPRDKVFFITMGKEGAAVYTQGKIEYFRPKRDYERDIIGAGDIAGSLFVLNYIETRDPFFSGKLTVTMMNCLKGKDLISKVNSIRKIFIDTWA